jgi:hypothetical protein
MLDQIWSQRSRMEKQLTMQVRRFAMRCVFAVLTAVMVSCAPWMRGAPVAAPEHVGTIRSLGIVNPIVGVYRAASSYNISPEPGRANTSAIALGAAITKHFGSLPGLQVSQVDLTRSEGAAREVAALQGWPSAAGSAVRPSS